MGFNTPGLPYRSTAECFAFNTICIFGFLYFATISAPVQAAVAVNNAGNNPLLATYDGGTISLLELEEFAREMPISQRIPFAKGAADWRRFMCGELAQSVTLTSQALQMGLHQNPGYLRSRDYFIQEYMCYLVLRDRFTNQMDISPENQQREYDTNKADYWLSPTVTLRVIRTRDADKISSAAAALKAGGDFPSVEMEYSQVSPRYRGRVVGPFPSVEERTVIPPPDKVIDAALALNEGETSGPLNIGGFHYLLQTEKKTAGRQQTPYEVAELVEERLRETEGNKILPGLIDEIQKELGVEVDENLFAAANTQPDDLLATVGALKIIRQEYTDLNGSVRGPAARIATMMPTRLKQFVLPYMIAQWAKLHDYMDRDETRKALYYYDLQHLSGKIAMDLAEQVSPVPTDEELRARFQANIADFRHTGAPEPRFEDHRDDMLNAIMQQRAPDVEGKVRKLVLENIHFKQIGAPVSTNISALEALSAADDQLTSDVRLLSISAPGLTTGPNGATPYEEIGRAPEWQITYDTGNLSSASSVAVRGPAPLLKNNDAYSSIPAFLRWSERLRFDTDALKRHAIDKGLDDFLAKHDHRVQIAAAIDFSYSQDDPTSPSDCLISYSATKVGSSGDEGFIIRYAGNDGEVTKRRLGEFETKCLTCPAGDLPAPSVIDSFSSKSISSAVQIPKGDL